MVADYSLFLLILFRWDFFWIHIRGAKFWRFACSLLKKNRNFSARYVKQYIQTNSDSFIIVYLDFLIMSRIFAQPYNSQHFLFFVHQIYGIHVTLLMFYLVCVIAIFMLSIIFLKRRKKKSIIDHSIGLTWKFIMLCTVRRRIKKLYSGFKFIMRKRNSGYFPLNQIHYTTLKY